MEGQGYGSFRQREIEKRELTRTLVRESRRGGQELPMDAAKGSKLQVPRTTKIREGTGRATKSH